MLRRYLYFAALIFVVFLLQSADAHILGIDYGSEYVKIAGAHGNQRVEIVLNELSQRKTDNYIGFRMGERYIGSSAKALAARFPLQTAASVNKLLTNPSSDAFKVFMDYRYEYGIDIDKNNSLSIPIHDAHGPFTALELNAMMLAYSKEIAVKDGVPDPKSVVITVSSSSLPHERDAMNQAAKLAGLNVLAFVDTITATAYYYGMRHRGFANKTVLLAIIDVGASKTEVGVFQISPPSENRTKKKTLGVIEKVASDSDFSLGGRALDMCIAEIVEEEAIKKMKISKVIGETSKEGLKSQFSLLRASKRIRETLSVNSETPFTVEGIAPDRDFSSVFTRSTFESKCAPLFQKVPLLVQKVLKESNVSVESLTAIELMGGVSRTPKLITDLIQLLRHEVGRTLNMDEAGALGAAYYAARLSPFYDAKSFALHEKFSRKYSFSISPPLHSKVLKRPLLLPDSVLGTAMSITVNRSSDFSIIISDETSLDGTEEDTGNNIEKISVFNVNETLSLIPLYNRSFVNENNTHLIRIQLRLTDSGRVEVEEVEAAIRYSVNVSTTNEVDGEENSTEDTDTSVIRVRYKTFPLAYEVAWFNPHYHPETLKSSSLKLDAIDREEKEKHERSASKNKLESYLFWVKNQLEDPSVVTKAHESTVNELQNSVASVEEWLEDGQGSEELCPQAEYEVRLESLKQKVEELDGKKLSNEKDLASTNVEVSGIDGDL